jgi:hypothetical protein
MDKVAIKALVYVSLAVLFILTSAYAEEITLTTIMPASHSYGISAPDFDSGWIEIPGDPHYPFTKTLLFATHNAFGKRTFTGTENPDNMLVFLKFKNTNVDGRGIHNFGEGGFYIYTVGEGGTYYYNLKGTEITIQGASRSDAEYIRVYIWCWE